MISREQLARRLDEAGWRFKRKNDRSEIWKKRNSSDRLTFTQAGYYSDIEVKSILKQAGLGQRQIEEFFRRTTKTDN